jgi:arginine decarboxylase
MRPPRPGVVARQRFALSGEGLPMPDWSVQRSADLYGISRWGGDYFDVGPDGSIRVRPLGSQGPAIDLCALVEDLRGRGHATPLLIRFSDLLASRVRELSVCFERAIAEYDYAGAYRGVYPIKVNQQRQVVEELVEFGRPHRLGLEAGSKPELLVALAILDNPDALIVCNGFKDRAYLETALLAQRLGRHPVIVLDRPDELDVLIKVACELGISPHIGVRARLSARGAGNWQDSSGDRSKFGLSASEMVDVVARLRAEDMLECLEMLHFHIGSQITDIRAHKEALREASRVFVGLVRLGAPLCLFDVGGGLGIDYDGSQSSFSSSMNYSDQEYAYDVVSAIRDACNETGVAHPDVVTEAGRALVAHASVLVFDVLGVDAAAGSRMPSPPTAGEHKVLVDLYEVWTQIDGESVLEAYHDAVQLKDEGTSLFNLGYLDLAARARLEELFWSCCRKIAATASQREFVPKELEGLERALSDTYYGNFSVFQSMPDAWAVKQLFPIVPIHRLDEEPVRAATLADLTCDSDGKVDEFIGLRDSRPVLALHPPNGRPYYLGAFLVGAYQETLGELHNLFGDTAAVHVHVEPVPGSRDGSYRIEQVIEGETVEDVLGYVDFDRARLVERVRRAIEAALRAGSISIEESALLRRRYGQALSGNTYLNRED